MSDTEVKHFQFIIIGGGVSGLLVGHGLKARGVEFLGLEKAEVLGGRSAVGHHRLYTEAAVELFKKALPSVDWKTISEPAKLRKKGDWEDFIASDEDKLPEDEKFYLRQPFFAPEVEYKLFVDKLSEPLKGNFELRKTVTAVFPREKRIDCQDGTKYTFDNLVWCSSLEHLNKLWQGDRAPLQKVMKKGISARGGIDLEWELNSELVPLGNTLVFPFRFKDHKLRALGIQEKTFDERYLFHLMVFLDDEISDDREEVAKCLRALRREFEKEFPGTKEKIKAEKIVYMGEVSGEAAAKTKTLELVPGLYYIGPQLQTSEEENPLKNLDLVAANCLHFEKTLWKEANA